MDERASDSIVNGSWWLSLIARVALVSHLDINENSEQSYPMKQTHTDARAPASERGSERASQRRRTNRHTDRAVTQSFGLTESGKPRMFAYVRVSKC